MHAHPLGRAIGAIHVQVQHFRCAALLGVVGEVPQRVVVASALYGGDVLDAHAARRQAVDLHLKFQHIA